MQNENETNQPADAEKLYTPPPVTGYRKLSQADVDLMNLIKAKGDDLGNLINLVLRTDLKLDQTWVDRGAEDIQDGIMKLVRAVAQPTNF